LALGDTSFDVFLQLRHILIILVCVGLISLSSGGSTTFASRVNQVVTNTVTVGTSFITSQSQLQQLVNGPFTVIATTGTTLPCEFWNYSFTSLQGQYLSLNVTSNIPLDVYVVPSSNYQNWLKEGSCGNQADAVASKLLTVAYSFNGVLPSSEGWDIVLVNSSNSRDASGFMTAYLATGNVVAQELLSTVTSTIPPVGITTMTTTANAPGIPGFPSESIVAGLLVGLVALMVIRSQRPRIRQA